MFMPGNYMAFSDCLIIACCVGITALALNKSRVRADGATRVVAIGISGVVIAVVNLLLDTHWIVPPVKTVLALLAIIYLAGASKGVLLGLLLSLFLFKQLRPIGRIGNPDSDAT
jgi:hypothetical protein